MKHIGYVPMLFLVGQSLAAQTDRPNVVVFLVDDMGLMDTSLPFLTDKNGNEVRHPLNEWYRTPNMERMARQGIRFSTFYAQSVSSPSRASIITGRMPHVIAQPIGSIQKTTTVRLSGQEAGTGTVFRRRHRLYRVFYNRQDIRRSMWGRHISGVLGAKVRTR